MLLKQAEARAAVKSATDDDAAKVPGTAACMRCMPRPLALCPRASASLHTLTLPIPPPQARASQLAWQAALSRASGEKVLDDPKLLRRSIKRDAKQKARNTKKWEERSSAQAEAQAARQDK